MKTVNDNGFNQSMNKKSAFLRFMRYVAVILVTVWLFVLMIASAEDDFLTLLYLYMYYTLLLRLFFITIPLLGFWIYSFVKAIKRRTKEDKIFLVIHIVDVLMVGIIAFFLSRPPQKCDAFIMADNYQGENGFWMRNIADRYRNMLPDSTRLVFEIDNDKSHPFVFKRQGYERVEKMAERLRLHRNRC